MALWYHIWHGGLLVFVWHHWVIRWVGLNLRNLVARLVACGTPQSQEIVKHLIFIRGRHFENRQQSRNATGNYGVDSPATYTEARNQGMGATRTRTAKNTGFVYILNMVPTSMATRPPFPIRRASARQTLNFRFSLVIQNLNFLCACVRKSLWSLDVWARLSISPYYILS